jgi:hypothetical protein
MPRRHFVGIRKPSRRVRAAAGLDNVRIHDPAAPLGRKLDPNSRTCVLFWPKRFDAEGPALEFCMERYSALFEVKGERNALLHYTPIQNRCEDHRLV